MVNPKPRDDLTSWQRRRSPLKSAGSRVKNGAEMLKLITIRQPDNQLLLTSYKIVTNKNGTS